MHLRVVAHVQVVVDLHRLGDGLRVAAVGGLVVSGLARVALAAGGGRAGRAVPLGACPVASHQAVDVGRRREIDRRRQELEHHPARQPHALGLGEDRHPRLDAPRAGRDQHPGAGHLDHAHPADVDRRQRLEEAQRGNVEPAGPARLEDRRAGRDPRRLAVDHDLDRRRGRSAVGATGGRLGGGGGCEPDRSSGSRGAASRADRARKIADSTALDAVCPSPQIEASRITWPRSLKQRQLLRFGAEPTTIA